MQNAITCDLDILLTRLSDAIIMLALLLEILILWKQVS